MGLGHQVGGQARLVEGPDGTRWDDRRGKLKLRIRELPTRASLRDTDILASPHILDEHQAPRRPNGLSDRQVDAERITPILANIITGSNRRVAVQGWSERRSCPGRYSSDCG